MINKINRRVVKVLIYQLLNAISSAVLVVKIIDDH